MQKIYTFWKCVQNLQILFRKRDDEGYGFSVRGDAPVVIAGVEPASLAHVSNNSNDNKSNTNTNNNNNNNNIF